MSWSERRRPVALALCAVAALAACGFTPAFAPGESAARLRGALDVAEPTSQVTYRFAQQMEARLGAAPGGAYRLGYAISIAGQGQAITADQVTQRYTLLGTVDYTVTETATGRVLTSGQETGFTGLGTAGTIVATDTAVRDAQDRLMVILADRVADELVSGSADWLP